MVLFEKALGPEVVGLPNATQRGLPKLVWFVKYGLNIARLCVVQLNFFTPPIGKKEPADKSRRVLLTNRLVLVLVLSESSPEALARNECQSWHDHGSNQQGV